jgi:hypothetical protein
MPLAENRPGGGFQPGQVGGHQGKVVTGAGTVRAGDQDHHGYGHMRVPSGLRWKTLGTAQRFGQYHA